MIIGGLKFNVAADGSDSEWAFCERWAVGQASNRLEPLRQSPRDAKLRGIRAVPTHLRQYFTGRHIFIFAIVAMTLKPLSHNALLSAP